MTVWLFGQIRISYYKFLMPKPLKWGILGAGTRIQSKDIHNYNLCLVRILMKQTLCALCMHTLIIFQYTNHRTLDPPITQYTLESLYPNSLYHVWVAAKSKRGEGATTPSLSARTEQYCKYLFSKHLEKKIWLIGGGKSQNLKNHNKIFTDHVFIIFLIILNLHFFKAKRSLETNFLEWTSS